MIGRRIILVNPRLQYRVILTFLCVAVLCMGIQSTLMLLAAARVEQAIPLGSAASSRLLADTVLVYSGIGLLLLIPLTVVVGLVTTLRIAGPIYRLEKHLEAICRGESPGPVRVRQGDECQELCFWINRALDLRSKPEGSVAEFSPPLKGEDPVETGQSLSRG